MITDQKRTIRKAQGYDLGFEYKGVEYWINTTKWNEEKAERFYKETGLKAFREGGGNKNLVFYDPEYFEVMTEFDKKFLNYIVNDEQASHIPQPINMTSAESMFATCDKLVTLDLTNWDVSNVIDMSYMFFRCCNLKELNIKGWDLANLQMTRKALYGCDKLEFTHGFALSSRTTLYMLSNYADVLDTLELF